MFIFILVFFFCMYTTTGVQIMTMIIAILNFTASWITTLCQVGQHGRSFSLGMGEYYEIACVCSFFNIKLPPSNSILATA